MILCLSSDFLSEYVFTYTLYQSVRYEIHLLQISIQNALIHVFQIV